MTSIVVRRTVLSNYVVADDDNQELKKVEAREVQVKASREICVL